jgi:hypothetical protein
MSFLCFKNLTHFFWVCSSTMITPFFLCISGRSLDYLMVAMSGNTRSLGFTQIWWSLNLTTLCFGFCNSISLPHWKCSGLQNPPELSCNATSSCFPTMSKPSTGLFDCYHHTLLSSVITHDACSIWLILSIWCNLVDINCMDTIA